MNSNTSPHVPVTVETSTIAPPERAFAIIAPIDLSTVFTGWGPFPAVRGTDNQTGAWNTPGETRNPVLSDGTTATEALTEYAPPHGFAYELTGFTNVLRHLVTRIRGEWTITADGAGSLVRWTYSFHPRPGRALAVRWALAPLWRRYARRVLDAVTDQVDQPQVGAPPRRPAREASDAS